MDKSFAITVEDAIFVTPKRRGVRVVDRARLESVCT